MFRKLYTKSAYSIQFGEPPKATEDYVIMKNKKFRELDISTYVQDQAKTYIEKWLSVNTSDQYIKSVYFVTREIHTIIRNA